jgi:hypothetical protein
VIVALNPLQRLMRRFDALHPYNGIHAVELRGAPDAAALSRAASDVLGELGIARVSFSHGWRRCELEGGRVEVEVRVAEAPEGPAAPGALASLAAEELARPFADGPALPLRLLVLRTGDTHHVGVTFAHWIAGGTSGGDLLERIVSRALGLPDPRSVPVPAPGRRPELGAVAWALAAARWARTLLAMRRCHQPGFGDRSDFATRVEILESSPDLLPRLRAAAARRAVSVNDLLCASLAEAAAFVTPGRLAERRRNLAFASIVDLREVTEAVAGRAGPHFGLLAFVFDASHLEDFELLVVETHTRKRAARARGEDRAARLLFSAADALWPFQRARQQAHDLASRFVTAGLFSAWHAREGSWAGTLGERVESYHRFPPTGPLAPLVLAPSTAAGRFSLTLSARAWGYTPRQVEEIIDVIGKRLGRL